SGAEAVTGSSTGASTRSGGAGTSSGGPAGALACALAQPPAAVAAKIPKPKTQIPKPNRVHTRGDAASNPRLGFGAWDLGFGICIVQISLARGSKTRNVVPRFFVDSTSMSPS